MTWGDGTAATGEPLRIDVVRGNPTDEELAALIAVVTEEYSSQEAAATASDAPTRSAWELSARNLRQPLRRELGWGRYGG
ncbi:acyl-CoA carboxylase subunit epsilon [Microbacterium sp.]|uniref:acyl-CoA carboxylase subunit epsilon n=1 Tax=Microbacterium sp. TaxID=51671 RepID=UPI003A944DE6